MKQDYNLQDMTGGQKSNGAAVFSKYISCPNTFVSRVLYSEYTYL